MPKVLNKYKLENETGIYIGRPSVWGNPFSIGKDGNREEVIYKYRNYINENEELKNKARQLLRDKNLICFCAPKACHGDILLEIANCE